MRKIVCPFCFHNFKRSEVEFRCGNGRCTKMRDPELEKFWGVKIETGININLQKSFPALILNKVASAFNTMPRSPKCPKCGEKSYLPICPHCHNPIPNDMIKKKAYIISIIGAKASGKTTYITTLINELQHHLCNLGDLGTTAVNITDEKDYYTQKRYEDDFFRPLYIDKKCSTGGTDIIGPKSKIPLIYKLTNQNKNIYLVFYDTAGENFVTTDQIARNVQFLKESDAAIFLLDSFGIPFVHDKLNLKNDIIESRYNVIVDILLSYFLKYESPKRRNAHFKKPIALVFSKIDAILANEEKFEDTALAGLSIPNNSNYLDGSPIMLSEFDIHFKEP